MGRVNRLDWAICRSVTSAPKISRRMASPLRVASGLPSAPAPLAPSSGPLSIVSSPPLPILVPGASVRPRDRREPLGMPGRHLVPAEAPGPAALAGAGPVHPRLAAQPQDVLQGI